MMFKYREGIPLPVLIRGGGWKDSLLFFLEGTGEGHFKRKDKSSY